MSKTESRIFHARKDGLTVPTQHGRTASGRTLSRGDEVTVDDWFIEAVRDRLGYSWAEHLKHDEQLERWGEIRYVEGIASEVDPQFFSELVAQREVAEAAELQRQKLEGHRYGSRYASAYAASVAKVQTGELRNADQ